nr:retinol dehydrogenase 11-like [Vanessa tameamea]
MIILYLIVVIVMVGMVVGLYQKNTNIICKSKKRLDGKTTIVTGGTSGMGLRIATDFADRGARVIVACPFVDEGTRGRKFIVDKTGNEEVIFKLLDLASTASIRKFSEDVIKTEKRLDILINNAGVGNVEDFATKDGLNFTMQVNYFGQYLLTLLLLPLLRKTGNSLEPSRIVNTASILHNIGSVNFEKINCPNYWYPIQLYANSKLCLILFTRELAKRLKDLKEFNVKVNSVDPGAVGTTIFNTTGKYYGGFITFLFSVLFKTPWEGAQTAIHVALDKKASLVSGELFKNCKLSRAKQTAYDDDLACSLWEESRKLIGLCVDEYEQCFQVLK